MTHGPAAAMDVVIVNHNTRDALRGCLQSLRAVGGVGTIWVADNGSTDGSLDMVHREFPEARTVSLPHNPGYGAAANELVARTTSELVLLLNADVRLCAGAADALRSHFALHPRTAMAGPRLVDDSERIQRSCFGDPDLLELWWRETGLQRRWKRARADDRPRHVAWVLGAVLVIRRSAFDQVSGFDPGFFLYFEEADLSRRLRDKGWTVDFVPAATARHSGGASTARQRAAAQRALYRSLDRYHRLHGGAPRAILRCSIAALMVPRLARDGGAWLLARDHDRAEAVRAWAGVLRDAARGWRPRTVGAPAGEAPLAHERVDWLTLLPRPAGEPPRLTFHGAWSAEERTAVADHFAVDPVADPGGDHTADVVVAKARSWTDVGRAVRSLRPGGVAYVQCGRRLPSAATSATTALAVRAIGGRVAGRWWIVPNADAPRRFVPLDARGPLRWYLRNLLVVHRPALRLGRRVLIACPALASWIARSHAIVVTRGVGRGELLEAAQIAGVGLTSDARSLVLTSGHDVGSRAVVLPFGDRASTPGVAIKVAMASGLNAVVRREHDHLIGLRALVSRGTAATVPAPATVLQWRGHVVGVEAFVVGRPLDAELRERRDDAVRITLLHEAAAWLTRVHLETAIAAVWTEARCARWIGTTFDRFRSEVAVSEAVLELLTRAERRAGELIGTTLPLVYRHVDFGPWNVIRTRDGVSVVDWESAPNRPGDGRGLPYCDLDYFVKYWLHVVSEDSVADVSRALAFGPAEPGASLACVAAARGVLSHYCHQLGIDARFMPVLTVYGWVEHALNAAARGTAIGRRAGGAAVVDLLEALASRPDALFDVEAAGSSQPRPRRVAVIAPFAPATTSSHGGGRVIAELTTELSRRNEVRLLATVPPSAGRPRIRHLDRPEVRVVEVERPARSPRLRRVRLLAAAAAGRPAWAFEWRSPAFDARVGNLVTAWRPDIMHVEFVVLAEAVPAWARDVSAVIVTDHDPPVATAFEHLLRDTWWMRPYRALELQAWVRTVRRAARRATLLVVFSHDDRRLLERLRVSAPVTVVPFTMRLPAMPLDPTGNDDPPTLVFVGGRHHPPNVDAMRFLVAELMPAVWAHDAEVRLVIVGSDPPTFVRFADPRIDAPGYVRDIAAVLDHASVVVAPLTSGRGMRVKVLEAMAYGKATVATTLATRGFPCEALDCLVVVDDLADFAHAVTSLLGDRQRRDELGRRARAWAEDWLAPDSVARRYEDLHELAELLRAAR